MCLNFLILILMKKLIIVVLLAGLLFIACAEKPEKDRFIDATTEVACMVFEANDVTDPVLEQKTKDIFTDHGFDVGDEAAMEAIATKYENDEDVQKAIQDALKECAGDLFENLENLSEDTANQEATNGEEVLDSEAAPEADAAAEVGTAPEAEAAAE